jgi:hypothetical protein
VIAVHPHGPDTVELTYKTVEGALGQRVLGATQRRTSLQNLARLRYTFSAATLRNLVI